MLLPVKKIYASILSIVIGAVLLGCKPNNAETSPATPDLAQASLNELSLTAYQPPHEGLFVEIVNKSSEPANFSFDIEWTYTENGASKIGGLSLEHDAYPNSSHEIEIVRAPKKLFTSVKIKNLRYRTQ